MRGSVEGDVTVGDEEVRRCSRLGWIEQWRGLAGREGSFRGGDGPGGVALSRARKRVLSRNGGWPVFVECRYRDDAGPCAPAVITGCSSKKTPPQTLGKQTDATKMPNPSLRSDLRKSHHGRSVRSTCVSVHLPTRLLFTISPRPVPPPTPCAGHLRKPRTNTGGGATQPPTLPPSQPAPSPTQPHPAQAAEPVRPPTSSRARTRGSQVTRRPRAPHQPERGQTKKGTPNLWIPDGGRHSPPPPSHVLQRVGNRRCEEMGGSLREPIAKRAGNGGWGG